MNDEARMTNGEGTPKHENRAALSIDLRAAVYRHSDLAIVSSFVIRHSSFSS
jgi:hypothetical protein